MKQPDFLQTPNHVLWSWGPGNDVWNMYSAAMTGDVSLLKSLVNKNPSLIRCESHYRTPLHFAVRENQIEAAKFLLEQGLEPTFSFGKGWHDNTVQLARDRGFQEMLNLLEQHQSSNWNISPAGDKIGDAIRDRNESKTRDLLVEHGVSVADQRGNQPIHWAVMTRQVELIKSLLQSGADINAQRPDGARPLDLTNGDYYYRGWRDLPSNAPEDHWSIMEFLIKQGAHYDLTSACRREDLERVNQILKENPDAATCDSDYVTWYSGFCLRSAVMTGNRELVELLLKHGSNPNHPEHGIAPVGGSLYEAAGRGYNEILELLLEHGGNPNQDVESSGCVLSAAQEEDIKQMLRQRGAIVDPFGCCYYGYAEDFAKQCEKDPHTANDSWLFSFAAERGYRDVVEVFLKHQPDLWRRMPARLGETPEITNWMIESGMQVNQVDWLGVHQLHHGCTPAELETWVSLGVDLNLVDQEHQTTPLGSAARRGDIEYARALLANGADPSVAGASWSLPSRWARRRGHSELESLLGN